MVKEDYNQNSRDLILQLDLIKVDLINDVKSAEIDVSIIGFYNQKISKSISKSIENFHSVKLFTKKFCNIKDVIPLETFFKIPETISSLSFNININNNYKKYYLNLNLDEFANFKNGTWNLKMMLHECNNGEKITKPSSSVNDLINRFQINQNFIRFKLVNDIKTSKVKTIIKNEMVLTNPSRNFIQNAQKSNETSCSSNDSVLYHLYTSDSSKPFLAFSHTYKCPFCYLILFSFESLINHFKSIHIRFICRDFEKMGNTNQVDIIPDEMFDGSYSSYLVDYKKNEHKGYGKCRDKPTKRKAGLLFCIYNNFYGKMLRKNNKNLLLALHSQNLTPFNSTQNRIYYHSLTNLPKNLDSDEDSDVDQEWLEIFQKIKFDQYANLNEGEKEIMNLWNKHCSKHNLIARCNVYNICEQFIKENISTSLINLENNCLLHFLNLFDFKLLKKRELIKLIELINESK